MKCFYCECKNLEITKSRLDTHDDYQNLVLVGKCKKCNKKSMSAIPIYENTIVINFDMNDKYNYEWANREV